MQCLYAAIFVVAISADYFSAASKVGTWLQEDQQKGPLHAYSIPKSHGLSLVFSIGYRNRHSVSEITILKEKRRGE
jgi:hypothetical protein